MPGEVADLGFLLIQARRPLRRLIEIAGRQGGDAQGVHEHPGPEAQPFLPGLPEIGLGPLAGGVRRAPAGVDQAQHLDRAVPAQPVLSGHHRQRPLAVSAGAGQVAGRESGVRQAPQAPADVVLVADGFRHAERFLERAAHRAGIILAEVADRQRAERVAQRDLVSRGPGELSRPQQHRIAGGAVTQDDQSPESAERECLRAGVARRRAHLQRRGGSGLRAGEIAQPERQHRQFGEGERPSGGRPQPGQQRRLCSVTATPSASRPRTRQYRPSAPGYGEGVVGRAVAAVVDGRPQVGRLIVQTAPAGRRQRPQLPVGALGQRAEVGAVPVRQQVALARRGQALGGVLADEIEHPEAGGAGPALHRQQRLVDQALDLVEDLAEHRCRPRRTPPWRLPGRSPRRRPTTGRRADAPSR